MTLKKNSFLPTRKEDIFGKTISIFQYKKIIKYEAK